MENSQPLESQMNGQKRISSKKILILVVVLVILAIAGFLLWLFSGNPNNGQAKLFWNANTEADLAGYKIYYGTSKRTGDCPPGGYANKIDAGNSTSFTVANLTNGATYYFSLTSYDKSGNESCFSSELSKTIEKVNLLEKAKIRLKKLLNK